MQTNDNQTLEFLYQETEIHFSVNSKEKNVMVNATEMAKLFDKRTSDYLQNSSTRLFLKELELTLKSVNSNIKLLDNRGHMGYYFHRLVALDFAAWLDVKFRVWMITTIDTLLFAKNEKVAQSFSEENRLISERNRIIKEAKENNNIALLDYLENEKSLSKTKYQTKKALDKFKSQYKMQL